MMKKTVTLLGWSVQAAACSAADAFLQQEIWEQGLQVVEAPFSYQQAEAYVKALYEKPSWAADVSGQLFCSLVHKAAWGRIWSLGFFYNLNTLLVRDEAIPLFGPHDFVLIPFWGEIYPHRDYYKKLIEKARYPENIFFLANCDADAQVLREEGVQAFTVSHNAFIDRNLFKPIPTEKRFDAVYCGCMRPQKRLWLAENLFPRMAIISHTKHSAPKEFENVGRFFNNPPIRALPALISQGKCGLILSAVEGGCYGSTEYLYCGVPVVSTISQGGRDAYYDELTAIIVEDDPKAIERAVNELCARPRDGQAVRSRALAVSDSMLDTLAYEILEPIFRRYNDPWAKKPRQFVERLNQSNHRVCTKGRVLFQPENATHPRIEDLKRECQGTARFAQ
jgi:hypothetical protein